MSDERAFVQHKDSDTTRTSQLLYGTTATWSSTVSSILYDLSMVTSILLSNMLDTMLNASIGVVRVRELQGLILSQNQNSST